MKKRVQRKKVKRPPKSSQVVVLHFAKWVVTHPRKLVGSLRTFYGMQLQRFKLSEFEVIVWRVCAVISCGWSQSEVVRVRYWWNLKRNIYPELKEDYSVEWNLYIFITDYCAHTHVSAVAFNCQVYARLRDDFDTFFLRLRKLIKSEHQIIMIVNHCLRVCTVICVIARRAISISIAFSYPSYRIYEISNIYPLVLVTSSSCRNR